MIGGVTRQILPHLPGVPHLHVNRPLIRSEGSWKLSSTSDWLISTWKNVNGGEGRSHFWAPCCKPFSRWKKGCKGALCHETNHVKAQQASLHDQLRYKRFSPLWPILKIPAFKYMDCENVVAYNRAGWDENQSLLRGSSLSSTSAPGDE